MKIIFVGTKNFHFFSELILSNFEKIILTSKNHHLPELLRKSATVITINEVYDENSRTHKLDTAQCLSSLSEIIKSGDEFRVFCNQEANLEVAEEIRKEFRIFDHMNSRVEVFRNKLLMKEIVSKYNLRAPHFIEIEKGMTPSAYNHLTEFFHSDFIIKPSSSVGSRGVYKISRKQDFINFINETIDDSCQFEAEEFIDGDLYEFDTALQNGELLYSNVSKYSCPMAELQNGTTLGSIMVERHEEIHKRIYNFGMQCLNALKALNGCFHMEIFHNKKNELVFLEIAARSPGLMTVPAYLCWEGVNMYDMELLIQSRLPASDIAFPPNEFLSRPSFFVVYPKIAGKVLSLNTPKIDAEIDIDWQVSPGQVVTDTTTNIDYAARFFVTCKNVHEAKQIFEWLTMEFEAISYV